VSDLEGEYNFVPMSDDLQQRVARAILKKFEPCIDGCAADYIEGCGCAPLAAQAAIAECDRWLPIVDVDTGNCEFLYQDEMDRFCLIENEGGLWIEMNEHFFKIPTPPEGRDPLGTDGAKRRSDSDAE